MRRTSEQWQDEKTLHLRHCWKKRRSIHLFRTKTTERRKWDFLIKCAHNFLFLFFSLTLMQFVIGVGDVESKMAALSPSEITITVIYCGSDLTLINLTQIKLLNR